MEMEVRIKVQISDDVEVTLTEEEARTLYTRLSKLFGNNNVYTPYWPYGTRDWTSKGPVISYFEKHSQFPEYNTGTGAEVPSPRTFSASEIESTTPGEMLSSK